MNAPMLFQIAVTHHMAGRVDQAEAAYLQALALDPGLGEAWHQAGVIALQAGRVAQARERLARATALDAVSPPWLVNHAIACRFSGALDEATLLLKRALTMVPALPEGWNHLGLTLEELGHLQEAVAAFQQGLALDPRHLELHFNLGSVLLRGEQWAAAVGHFEAAARLAPEAPEVLLQWGSALLGCGRLEEAAAVLRRGVALAPDFAELWWQLGELALAGERKEEAARCWRRALALQPRQPQGWSNLGGVLLELGQPGEAEEACLQALALWPGLVEAMVNLGLARLALGRHGEAVAVLEEARSLAPGKPETWLALSQAEQAAGRLEQAHALVRAALERDGDHAEALHHLGVVCKELGLAEAAGEAFARVVLLRPSWVVAWLNLATWRREREELAAARQALERARALAPDLPRVYAQWGTLAIEEGDEEEARAAWERALALGGDGALALRKAMLLPVIPRSVAEIAASRERFAREVAELIRHPAPVADPVRELVALGSFQLSYQGADDRPLLEALARAMDAACPELAFVSPRLGAGSSSRIRLGVVSRYFYNHTVGRFFRGVLAHLPRERFQVTAFFLPGPRDALSQWIGQAVERRIDLPASYFAARAVMAGESLDILLYTDLGMDLLTTCLAHGRLAPVQATLYGHPETSGLPGMDWFISSRACEGEGAEAHYSERLALLPEEVAYTYYHRPLPPQRARSRSDQGLPEGRTLYLCTQSLFKIHPDMDAAFDAILDGDPAGELLLFEGRRPGWRRRLQERFDRNMTHGRRVRFLPRRSHDDFLAVIALGDVVLDSFHFCGGNTSFDTLAMGTPLVTWPGRFLRGRQTLGLYRRMGMASPVAGDVAGYVRLALALGRDRELREGMRREILERCPVLFEDRGMPQALGELLAGMVAQGGR